MIRNFELVRHSDVSGVSGTGVVAEGTVFSDGAVALRWKGKNPSTAAWDGLAGIIAVHGHEGATEVRWLDVAGHQWLHYEGNPHRIDHRKDGGSWHAADLCAPALCGATPEDATPPAAGGGA
jgi:hypothetical protein